MEPLVTIAIPDFAGPAARNATLAALTHHTPEPYEVVVLEEETQQQNEPVNSGSVICHQIIVSAPFSIPVALNRLLTTCTAPLILLLESGTIVTAGWLARLLAPLSDPSVGLSGPSTNVSWNEQQVFSGSGSTGWSVTKIEEYATGVAKWYQNVQRSLDTLHGLGDFCYLFKRSVAKQLGGFDEAYGAGPCWEIDFNTRAARAGFRAIWVADAYVHRGRESSWKAASIRYHFTRSKQLYQDRFCGLRLHGEKNTYEAHCRGEACPHFAPIELIQVRLQNGRLDRRDQQTKASESTTDQTSVLPVHKQSDVPLSDIASIEVSPHIHSTDTLPLVSCIMPTHSRRAFVQQALTYFEQQDYPNKELIIVDDGDDQIADLVSSRPYVRYVPLAQKTSIGAKRNLACQQAQGQIIAHWDDDDWYAPHRLTHQVAPLLADQADITGLETFCFFDIPHWQAWSCSPELHRRLFAGDVHGGTLVYRRFVWERLAKYPNVSLAEDAYLLRAACRQRARLLKLPHARSFVYLRHEHNAWSFPLGTYLNASGWQLIDPNTCIPEDDLPFYSKLSPVAPLSTARKMESQEDTAHPQQIRVALLSGAESMPLVSCIMPTYNRRHYVPQAILYFLRQEYPHRELLIVDDGSESVADLVPADPRVRYIRLDTRMILGAKRNLACKLAQGTIIAHWDDDDWMASHRLRYQVDVLEREKADLCGAGRQLYYSPTTNQAWLYEYPATIRRWLAGNTLCYRKVFWEMNPFPEIAIGEDTHFAWSPRAQNAVVVPEHTFYIGLVHEANTSRKNVRGNYWHSHSVEVVQRLLGADIAFYRP